MFVVLAQPRTGSSLLMQTIAALGYPIVGKKKRLNLAESGNPKGYMEEHPLLKKGFSARYQARFADMNPKPAFKLSLTEMVNQPREDQWDALYQLDAEFLLTIRHPLEAAISNNALEEIDQSSRAAFFQVTSYLRNYVNDYRELATMLKSAGAKRASKFHFVFFDLAHHSAADYVNHVIDVLGIDVSDLHRVKAQDNIDTQLYRYRNTDFSQEYHHWYRQSGAERIYQRICAAQSPVNFFRGLSSGGLTNPSKTAFPKQADRC